MPNVKGNIGEKLIQGGKSLQANQNICVIQLIVFLYIKEMNHLRQKNSIFCPPCFKFEHNWLLVLSFSLQIFTLVLAFLVVSLLVQNTEIAFINMSLSSKSKIYMQSKSQLSILFSAANFVRLTNPITKFSFLRILVCYAFIIIRMLMQFEYYYPRAQSFSGQMMCM